MIFAILLHLLYSREMTGGCESLFLVSGEVRFKHGSRFMLEHPKLSGHSVFP